MAIRDIDPETAVAIKTRTPRGRFLTAQEAKFVGLYCQGMPLNSAALAAGYQKNSGPILLQNEAVAETITALKMRQMDSLGEVVTRDFVGQIFLEAHKKAATATEEIAAGRELGKLYGLYAPEKGTVEVNVQVNRIEQLESLSDAELMRLAKLRATSLSPGEPIEGEVVDE